MLWGHIISKWGNDGGPSKSSKEKEVHVLGVLWAQYIYPRNT